MLREHLDLCGLWKFQPDPGKEGEKAAYFEPGYADRRWREVCLPDTFDTAHPDLASYEGAGWFRRAVSVPPGWAGKRVVLRFEGVNYHARVWVNGRCVGEHQDGFLPFEFPVQEVIRLGEQNVVAVRADNTRLEGEVPGLQRGWRTYGGILREVELVAMEPVYLEHATVVAVTASGGGRLALRALARNERAREVEAALSVRVIDDQGQTLARFTSQPILLGAGKEAEFALEGHVPGAQPWSPVSPALYTAEIELSAGGQPVDGQAVRFGFRTIEAREGKLLLNGEPIYLTGFNRHEDSPQHDMATDLETARRDLVDMKEAGANFVRLCHYPHHPGEIDLCDELGLLAMGEIPLYWWDGYQEGEEHCAQKLAAARRQLAAMIRRDANHPALIFWSVSNENHEERPEVVDGNRELVSYAQALDPTRLAVHVSSHWRQHAHFGQDDVICVNAYPSLDARISRGEYDYDWSTSTRFWRDNLQTLHEAYPHKPILITEFGYAAWQDVYGAGAHHAHALGEDAQAQAIEAEFSGMDAPYVCGATIWCWADHPWPPATYSFSHYLALSPYGVVTRERRKLAAHRVVRRLFLQKQGLVEPPRPAGPLSLGQAGIHVNMSRPNLLDIPQVPFPEGFSIRPMRLDEGGLWTDIERDAEEYLEITDDTFHQEFGRDLQATQWRSFIVVNQKGVGVGTISAWYDRNYRGQDYGRIHWLAVRPAYQGRGLGRAALSFAMNELARWHDRATLGTQTRRLPAIKLYLDFGFLPEFDEPEAVATWHAVQEQLHQPVEDRLLRER